MISTLVPRNEPQPRLRSAHSPQRSSCISNAFVPARCGNSALRSQIQAALCITCAFQAPRVKPGFAVIVQEHGCPGSVVSRSPAVGVPCQDSSQMCSAPFADLSHFESGRAVSSADIFSRCLSRGSGDPLDRGNHLPLQAVNVGTCLAVWRPSCVPVLEWRHDRALQQ